MRTDRKTFWAAAAIVALLLLVALVAGKVEQELAPEPRAAWVGIQVADGPAEVGRVEIESGTPFTLHAVLEAVTWRGETIYFTEAERLRIDGEEVPVEALRSWKVSDELRILWFAVEGFTPYLEALRAEDLSRFHFRETFRSDWPRSWSVPGDLRPSSARLAAPGPETGLPAFGTQRFHVRLEFFGPESKITPRQRFSSLGAGDLPAKVQSFPTVSARLSGRLGAPSRVFGLTQIELAPGLGELRARLVEWSRQDIVFSRLTVLRELLDEVGADYDELAWVGVDLASGPGWGEDGVEPGDLLRVGERLVILLQDHGIAGTLDYDDLCFDFFRGASVRPLREVFVGEGLVEWTSFS